MPWSLNNMAVTAWSDTNSCMNKSSSVSKANNMGACTKYFFKS